MQGIRVIFCLLVLTPAALPGSIPAHPGKGAWIGEQLNIQAIPSWTGQRLYAQPANTAHPCSPKKVETYRSRLMKKLGVTDLAELVKFAIQHGVTQLE